MDVTIEDDSLLEIDEVFRATLGLVNSDDSSRVTLSPAEASVTIFDDDGKCDRYSYLYVGNNSMVKNKNRPIFEFYLVNFWVASIYICQLADRNTGMDDIILCGFMTLFLNKANTAFGLICNM